MPTARIAALLLAAMFALTACERESPPPPVAVPEVTVAPPLQRAVTDYDSYIGRFEAIEQVEVRPRVSGYLREIHFTDGDRVEQGDLLFTIDARPFEAERDAARGRVSAAEARLDNAQAEFERAEPLVDVGAVSREEYEKLVAVLRTTEADLAAARAQLRTHELDVEFTRVIAPIAGRVSYRRADRGNAVVADTTLLTTIVAVDPIYFIFQGSEALYLKYRRDEDASAERTAHIRLQDEAVAGWHGRLDFIDNALDPATGTIRGRAIVENADGFLTPGLFGHLQLQASAEYTGLLLPDSAIATQGADRIVFVVSDDGIVDIRQVELGPMSEGLRVIQGGITANDRVVINGQQRARPGQSVQVVATTIAVPTQIPATR